MPKTLKEAIKEAGGKAPAVLYRYQPDKIERVKQVVLDNTLYFGMPKDFNDPFDFRTEFDHTGTKVEWIEKFKMMLKKYEHDLSDKEIATIAR